MKTCRNRNGFSMIEVLVASAILVVIVLMLAMLFQQTSLSWRTGVKRADAYMAIRSAIGAIQRDASRAVDERTIPVELRNKVGGSGQKFSDALNFYTLAASGFKDSNKNGRMDPSEVPFRTLSYITYNMNGDRKESVLMANGGTEEYDSNVLDFIENQTSPNKPKPDITDIEPESAKDPNGLPLYVKIQAEVTYSGNTLEIGAASAGPDKTWNTKDDIQTWQ